MPRSPAAPALAACLLLSAAPLYAGDAEDAAAKAVEKLGGGVIRDDADPAHPVVSVGLEASQATDAALKDLAVFKQLKRLDLALCLGVTDKGMKAVAKMSGLESLNVSNTKVTDAGLKRLSALKGLKDLNLIGDNVTDEGVADFQKALPDCKITR